MRLRPMGGFSWFPGFCHRRYSGFPFAEESHVKPDGQKKQEGVKHLVAPLQPGQQQHHHRQHQCRLKDGFLHVHGKAFFVALPRMERLTHARSHIRILVFRIRTKFHAYARFPGIPFLFRRIVKARRVIEPAVLRDPAEQHGELEHVPDFASNKIKNDVISVYASFVRLGVVVGVGNVTRCGLRTVIRPAGG